MSQKFISLEDAATKLGVAKDRLNQLREAGELRAYRDGASWKFRTEEIDKIEAEGLPSDDGAGDDLTLDTGGDFELAGIDDDLPELSAEVGESTASGADAKPASEEASDDDADDIGLGVEPLGDGDDAESILLTDDDEIEGGIPRPQSTIIGKSELSLEDDLELAAASGVDKPAPPEADKPAPSGSFEDIEELEELELDLEAESSRLLDSKVTSAARDAASAKEEAPAALDDDDELELDLAGSDAGASDLLSGEDNDDAAGLSGPGSVSGLSGIDKIDLADDEDDDLVLGGSDGSGDLASGDSGINLSPSDSGFALDEVPLDLGGSALGSALDLASLSAASAASGLGQGPSSGAEDFQLTPADGGEDDEDSSQIVALEEVGEEDEDLPGFEAVDDDDDDDLGEGFSSEGFSGGIGTEAAAAPVVVGAAPETPFPGWVVGLLGAGLFSMLLCGVMAMDLAQTMWSWDEPYSVTSSLMDGLLGIFGG